MGPGTAAEAAPGAPGYSADDEEPCHVSRRLRGPGRSSGSHLKLLWRVPHRGVEQPRRARRLPGPLAAAAGAFGYLERYDDALHDPGADGRPNSYMVSRRGKCCPLRQNPLVALPRHLIDPFRKPRLSHRPMCSTTMELKARRGMSVPRRRSSAIGDASCPRFRPSAPSSWALAPPPATRASSTSATRGKRSGLPWARSQISPLRLASTRQTQVPQTVPTPTAAHDDSPLPGLAWTLHVLTLTCTVLRSGEYSLPY